MMVNQSYEQRIGLLTNTAYGSGAIPTLLGNDGSTAGNYTNDHPVGQMATISTGSGLVNTAGVLTVTPGTPYAQFVANYGWPALAPGKYSNPYGVTATGAPYVVCTTCHNQHVMTVYTLEREEPDRQRRRRQVLRHLLLRQRSLQPEHQQCIQYQRAFDRAVLPPVPLWRVERIQ